MRPARVRLRFGIDLDAYSGAKNLIYANSLHDNSYHSGILIEQGSTFSVIHGNNIGPNNAAGVAFYNNEFPVAATRHHVLSNTFFGNNGAAVSYGSINKNAGNLLTTDSYILNNAMSGNGKSAVAPAQPFGIRSNGPVAGLYLANNADADGFVDWIPTKGLGIVFVNDYFRRSKLLGEDASKAVSPLAGVSLNATLSSGKLTVLGDSSAPASFAMTCAGINAVIAARFATLSALPSATPPFKDAAAWMWAGPSSMRASFLTVVGAVDCDEPIRMQRLLVLVLKDATITARPGLSAVFDATAAHYAAVLATSPSSSVQCGLVGASAVSVSNSAFFTVEGLRAVGCGSLSAGAINIANGAGADAAASANNTLLSNVALDGSLFNGVQVANGRKVMVSKASITNSGGAGLAFDDSTGTLLVDSVVSNSVGDGVSVTGTSPETVVVGTSISGSGGNGVALSNNKAEGKNINSVVNRNTIFNNKGGSVLVSASTLAQGMYMTVVAGNSFYGNGRGVEVGGCAACVQRLTVLDNNDTDGAAPKLTASRNYKNYRLDPFGRFSKIKASGATTTTSAVVIGGVAAVAAALVIGGGASFIAKKRNVSNIRSSDNLEMAGDKRAVGVGVGGEIVVAAKNPAASAIV